MKIKRLTCIASIFLASLGAASASNLTAWTFDNVGTSINASPSPSTGIGMATALGMDNSYNNTNSVSNPDVQSLAGSSFGGANSWRIRGYAAGGSSRGNGWSTNAPIGTQGAQFTGSTFGFHQIEITFDVYATPDAEANLQVQYTYTGTNWVNATITSSGTAVIHNNSSSANTVLGSYVSLVSGWNNQITANLTGLSPVDNNANFAIRLVNASTGEDCTNTTGTIYNNTSGSWTFDNVAIQGSSIDYVADWIFDLWGTTASPTNTVPAVIGSGTGIALGMTSSYNSTNNIANCDVAPQAGASTGAGSYCWRVRAGGGPPLSAPNLGNGWSTQAPIGTQGAEFDANTSGYNNIICTFDVYSTSAAEGKLCVQYTTDNWVTTNVAPTLFYAATPSFILTNSSSSKTVTGTYMFWTTGQNWYNNVVVDFSSIPAAANNPSFGIRIVNAATGTDCLNAVGAAYNNSSGNWRFDNVVIGGTSGNAAPTVTYDPNATVDGPFTNTFTENPAWRSSIYAVYVNGVALGKSAYTNYPGQIVFTPSKSSLLKSSGQLNIAINATGFGTARYPQPLAAGVATTLAMTTQAAGPSASGGTLTANPVFLVSDQYGNGTTNPYANVTIAASVGGAGGWTLGGDTTQTSVVGVIAFTNLSATLSGSSAISNAYISFAVTGYTGISITNSTNFNIGIAPVNFTPGNLAVLQFDRNANNTTFSIIELQPSTTGQTSPVNIIPVSATVTNGLRMSNSGSCGRLSLSDDGTLVCFAAFADNSAATPDETFNLNRVGAGMDFSGQVTNALNYLSTSLGGSQARACTSFSDGSGNIYWITCDKAGLYGGHPAAALLPAPNYNPYNNVVVRSFGGVPWVETQKAVAGLSIPVVYYLTYNGFNGTFDGTVGNNLGTDGSAQDFYLISTNGGTTYDVLYILDAISSTNAVINKYSYVGGNWVTSGTFANSTGGNSLFATTNGSGGVYLYYTTASSSSNSLIRITDASGWNAPIQIVSSNVLYTAPGKTYLNGVTFTPQQNANVGELIPPPILSAQTTTGYVPFNVTITPDDSGWRSAITSVTVNGSPLPVSAYSNTQSGRIVFYPSQSALLRTAGAKTIAFTATGYSGNSVVQTLTVPPLKLQGTTVSGGNISFSFNYFSGLSYSVHSTNDITAPVGTWPVIGPANENPTGSGSYQFSAPTGANAQQYYIISQP